MDRQHPELCPATQTAMRITYRMIVMLYIRKVHNLYNVSLDEET